MSIFNDHISTSGDEIIEQHYDLIWDWIDRDKIIKGLFPKRDKMGRCVDTEHDRAYYNPQYIFYIYLNNTINTARHNAHTSKKNKGGCRGEILLNKIDKSNLWVRFNKIINDCEVLIYKDNKYILINPFDVTIQSLRNNIISMMYNYITTETCNSRYFKK